MIGVYFLLIANSAPRYALSTNSSCLCLQIKNCLNYKQNPANENWFDFAVLIRSRESKLKAHMKARRFSDDCTQQMSGVSNETDSPPLFNAIPSDQREDFITEMSLFVPPVNSNYFNITTCFMVTGNFSLQYQYNIKQEGDENKEKYQLWNNQLIQYQIL